ncbi:hypothetical protein [Nocardia stercoris]|uniref:hypothetical protein n=1 Tax=Nocardia stercoris TaxID=2483361 RepID=UPI0011C43189|nr:hypothetical protein [Nocardia stercoris]
MLSRRLAIRVAAIVALACGWPAAPAQADPLPQWTPFGTTIYTFGDAKFCTGTIAVALEAAHGRPGHVLAHIAPLGYQRGPCGNHVVLGWVGSAGARSDLVYVWAGVTPGTAVTEDLWVGTGFAKLMADTWPPQGTFTEWYMVVP